MSKLVFLIFIVTFGLGLSSYQIRGMYSNPVINYSLPDPSIIQAPDGCFYLYATEDIPNMPILKSRNLVDWESVGTVLQNRTGLISNPMVVCGLPISMRLAINMFCTIPCLFGVESGHVVSV